ncbi:MAG: YfiT family bacillithiol transferase [Vicinamibacterales bacterium]
MTTDLRYPIGPFDDRAPVTPDMREPAITIIADLPSRLRAAVAGLSGVQLDTPYRPNGWTVRQVVHHVADSHVNAYIRTKLGLTEQEPTIKPYDQELWAPLADSRLPVDLSLMILDGVHARWAVLWRSLSPDQFARIFHHPEIGVVTLDSQLQMYAWHSRHHVAHITALRQREGWLGGT